MNIRRLAALGTGIGIRVLEHDLEVTAVRLRPGRAKVLGWLKIAGFKERPAAEWGAEYADFTRRLHLNYLAATVLLPRREVIVRLLDLPGVEKQDLASAVALQIDSFHPYGEEEVDYGWTPVPASSAVLTAIVRREVIERHTRLFLEAGIKVATFSISPVALYSAVRLLDTRPEGAFLAIGGGPEPEAYGESPARPVFSALLGEAPERATALAAAELRLESDSQVYRLEQLLPPAVAPADFDPAASALSYAAALAGACPWPALRVNMLPAEFRSAGSRWRFIPTAALGTAALVLVTALGAYGRYEERHRMELLRAEIARYEPAARKAAETEKAIERARARIRFLYRFHGRTRASLECLEAITTLLEPPAWLNSLEMDDRTITLSGQAEQAAPLLKLLDSSPLFRDSEFVGAIGKAGKQETFRIRTFREEVFE